MQTLADLPRPLPRYVIGLWKRRWLIVLTAWIIAIAGWIAVALLPDYYESRAQIYVDTDTALNETLEESARRADIEKRVRVMTLQLLSRENLEQVIVAAGLDAGIREKALETAPGNPAEQARVIEVLTQRKVTSLSENIRITPSEAQYYIIAFADKDPVTAKRVVDAVITLFIEKDVGAAMSQSETALNRLDREIARYEQMLNEKDREIAAFRRENADKLAGNETNRRRLDQKETELSSVQFSISQAMRRQQSLRGELAATPRNSSGSELDQLKLQLAQLQSQYRDNYPDIIALKAKIAELESGSDTLPTNPEYQRIEASLRAVDDELAVLRQRQNRLDSDIDTLTLTASQVPEVQADLQEIMRNYDQIEASYEDLLSERQRQAITASLSEGGGTVEYNLYEAPTIAAEPSSPARGLLTLAVLVAGLGAGAGLAFLLIQVDRSYTQTSELEDALGLPVLGSISPARRPGDRAARRTERVGLAGALAVLVLAAGGLFWLQEIRVEASDSATASFLDEALS